MERRTYAATPQEALVRILGPSDASVGTGCLTVGGLIVTCAHVVRAVLGLKREQLTGALPLGRVKLQFPFPPGWRDRTDLVVPKTFEAEVAPGGWGWIERVWHGNDIAILRLIGEAPFACGRQFSCLDHTTQDIPAFVQGFRAKDPDAGAVKGTLMAQGGLPDGRRIFDCKDAAYRFDFGFSGAPVFIAHDAAAGIFIGDPSYEDGSVREPHRVAYVLPASRVTTLLDAVMQAAAPPRTPEALRAACAYIPVMKASFEQLVGVHNSAAPFVGGVSNILHQLEILAAEPLDDTNLKCFHDIIGDLRQQEAMAKARGYDKHLTLFGLGDFCRALRAFGEKLRPQDYEAAMANAVRNDVLEENKLPHWSELQAVKKAVGDRLNALASQILPVSPELQRRVRNTLFRLSRQLDLDPLYLSVINEVRAELEALDRSLFTSLIVQIETLMGVYAGKLPDLAVFRDFPEGPEMIVIPTGHFMMGAREDEQGRFDDEGPQHEVTIPKRFAIGRYALTVGEFAQFAEATRHVMPDKMHIWTEREWEQKSGYSWRKPGFEQTEWHPVVGTNWNDAQAYISWLEMITEQGYRLPSEAEWEYCCRAESGTRYSFGDDEERLGDHAWYDANSENKTHPVGEKKPNIWGLYDMHGNVWEWCEDIWHEDYREKPEELRANGGAWTTGDSSLHVVRGGSWVNNPRGLRSAFRYRVEADGRDDDVGFRVARTLTS